MNTSSTSVAEGDTRRQARRGLVVFFALVVPLTVVCITTGNPFWGFPLMWSVAVASVVTRLVLREGFADVSFRFGGGRTWKYLVLAPIIPITIGLIAYGIAWTTGLARFDPQPAGLVPSLVGDTASPITIFVVILAWAATIGTITSAVSAAGEEIGWRGYMLTRMIDAGVPRRPILVSGVIWGLWHVPLILGGVLYADSPSPVLTAGLFMVLATSFAYVLARMRLETGSIWPVIALHAAYNSIIQTAFAPVTAGAGAPLWVGMEAGILVVLTTVVVAVIFSRGQWTIRRVPEAREGAGAPGSPAPQTQTKPNIHGSVVENRRRGTTRGDGVSRKMTLLAAIVALVLSVAAPAPASGRSANDSAKGNSAKNKDFAGLVDIGGGRKMYLECHGKGSPTVVFVSGVGDRAETWSKTLDPSKQPVLPAMAETNRVCAYDRPGTYLADGEGEEDFEKSRSDPVPQPTTLQDGVADLHALLSASGERGPYVLVGH